jgi:hypothetical protein
MGFSIAFGFDSPNSYICFSIMQFQKTCIDQLHSYHEVDDDHHIVVEDGTSKK